MVTSPIQQPATVTAVPHPRPALAGDLCALVRALAAPPAEPGWREHLVGRLGPVRRGFAEHVRLTEGPAGLYAELLHQAPRLDRGVRLLADEHVAIAAAIVALQHAVRLPAMPAEELRELVRTLLRALDRHRQRGADLLWEAYQADLGGED
ncbi:hypothetical protein ACFFMM_04355 [Micromonospora chaiyaphumensis]|uniref:Hemerythrin HHE cation binding domain-containing protein n=1 Tax=Micromonospora chaiyaphumensis TaxID=307119 RepID=A0A1C4V4W1_9ACTN|nr:hypothetical protein [Micromonospora chaiyaphumensis]SCE79062.1 hypothetical protein GA0070214_10223 [Micromonospora chaiyaphumensis]